MYVLFLSLLKRKRHSTKTRLGDLGSLEHLKNESVVRETYRPGIQWNGVIKLLPGVRGHGRQTGIVYKI